MFPARRPPSPFLAFLLAAGLIAAPAAADEPPWLAPFAGEPAAVAAAAAAVEPISPEGGVTILLDESEIRFEADGRRTHRQRLVVRIGSAAAVAGWGKVGMPWAPWFQERPEVRARVIAAGGDERWLDLATLSEQPIPGVDEATYTDLRLLTAPLPGIGVGAVSEEEWVRRDSAPYFAAGVADRHVFGRGVAVARERLVIDVPSGLPFAFDAERMPVEPRREEVDGRVRWTWELLGQEARDAVSDVPGDVAPAPTVEFATGRSWAEVGAAYARWVEERVSGFEPPQRLASRLAAAAGRREKIAAALAWLHEEVRYTGLELGEASIVPAPPAAVLARKYGDCKDKATLLVAALRQAGIAAEVALLATGPGPDVDPDLPGLGLFDHAIVHLPGEPEPWIDATAQHVRFGQLPAADRGRWALVARAEGAELLRTPDAAAAQNLFRLGREVRLGEWGNGEVSEWIEAVGEFEPAVRSTLEAAAADDEVSKAAIEEPPATDPSQPLVVRFPPQPAGTVTEEGWASVAVDRSFLFTRLAEALPAADERREVDLETLPYVSELGVRVVPPAGFTPYDPPPAEERQLGVARFTRRVETGEDGSLLLELRLDSGPPRLTPEQAAATRAALDEVLAEAPLELRFQSRGQALLDAGKVVEAVAELRRLVADGGGAADRARLAAGFLAAGLGEAAVREARAAVAADPEAAFAHRALGFALLHDAFGRLFQPGSDLTGSESALRRARELDPRDQLAAFYLALLLEHDADGSRYSSGARLDEAIAIYREVRDELGLTAYDQNLLVDLWRTGRYEEVAELAKEQTVTMWRSFLVAALAARQGAPAAVREAARIATAEQRSDTLSSAAELLLIARRYPVAAELWSASAQGAPDAAARLARAASVAALVPYQSQPVDPSDPRQTVLRLVRALMLGDDAEIERHLAAAEPYGGFPEALAESLREEYRKLSRLLERRGTMVQTVLDVPPSALDIQADGAPEVGHRVRVVAPDGQRESWYLAAGGGAPVVLTESSGGLAPLGRQARRLLDRGDLAGARRWLDWAREEVSAGTLDDPWSGHAIAAFWRRGEAGDEAACRRAANALLAASAEASELVEVLEAGLAGAVSEAERQGYEKALLYAYLELERWEGVERLARGRLAASPDSTGALISLSLALQGMERFDDLSAVAAERLERRPDDVFALRIAYRVASARGDYTAAIEALERLVAAPDMRRADFNELAWLRLLAGTVDEGTLEEAHRAVQGAGDDSGFALHTLASLFAELGRPLEAKDVIVQALDASGTAEPDPNDWYVLGRIAESYGETDIATVAYERVEKPEAAGDVPTSTWTLAQRRLATIAAAEPPGAQAAAGEEMPR